MDTRHFRRVSGYVTQDEILFPLLTVDETLMYRARPMLHDGHNMGAARVRELLKELGLEHVAKSRIDAESNRGISGGEKHRVSIGIDLVHDPAVLLIDEPTSGLDSASALDVALLLKSMAMKQGKTIVLTIHQPASAIRRSFHSRHVNVLEFPIELTEALVLYTEESREEEHADADQDCRRKVEVNICYANPHFKEIMTLG
ncbi:hypothetical protein PTKIN_Ptkin17bG0045400 [Pterospermum kingtungense]